jgi:hypothetical protein
LHGVLKRHLKLNDSFTLQTTNHCILLLALNTGDIMILFIIDLFIMLVYHDSNDCGFFSTRLEHYIFSKLLRLEKIGFCETWDIVQLELCWNTEVNLINNYEYFVFTRLIEWLVTFTYIHTYFVPGTTRVNFNQLLLLYVPYHTNWSKSSHV